MQQTAFVVASFGPCGLWEESLETSRMASGDLCDRLKAPGQGMASHSIAQHSIAKCSTVQHSKLSA